MNRQALCEDRTRRIACITVTPELILDLLKIPEDGVPVEGGRAYVVADAIPMDAKVVRCGVDADERNIVLVIEDESLEEVVVGHRMPTLLPEYEIVRDDGFDVVPRRITRIGELCPIT